MIFWIKEWENNHLLRDITIELAGEDTRTHKVFDALEKACYELDLGKPMWLETNIKEFKRHASTKFRKDCFIEEVPFDFLEFSVIEED